MEAGKIGDYRRLAAAAFANDRAAVWFDGGIVAVKARLDSRNSRFEQRIFNQ